jgi:hypothetical protein
MGLLELRPACGGARREPVSRGARGVSRRPGVPWTGTDWRDTTTVYGPAFTLASEPLARAAGSSADAAAWIYKGIAAAALLTTAALAARLSRRRSLAFAFVAWNPVLAVHFAGGGHNDALVILLVVGALAAAAAGRRQLAGVCWAVGALVKWVAARSPAVARARGPRDRATRRSPRLRDRRGRRVRAALRALRDGWLHAFGPLARNANHETSGRCRIGSSSSACRTASRSRSSRGVRGGVCVARAGGVARQRAPRPGDVRVLARGCPTSSSGTSCWRSARGRGGRRAGRAPLARAVRVPVCGRPFPL